MRIALDPASRAPLSAQLRDGLAARIERGRFAPGERLPPIRDLATDLGLAPNTVARAYRGLEEAGLVVTRGRHGTYVTERLPERSDEVEEHLRSAASAFARRAGQLGVDRAEALRAVHRALEPSSSHGGARSISRR
ncbi:MAG TPA: GntR family transcriptional regulator [Actinomycetota bacterium]|nr:GntR family transcriptional regulator [Actinomycetota bacterium]